MIKHLHYGRARFAARHKFCQEGGVWGGGGHPNIPVEGHHKALDDCAVHFKYRQCLCMPNN